MDEDHYHINDLYEDNYDEYTNVSFEKMKRQKKLDRRKKNYQDRDDYYDDWN